MFAEIRMANGNICDFENKYGVTFGRENASLQEYNGFKVLNLLAMEWTKPTVAPNQRIIGLIVGIDPSSNSCGIGTVVFENSGSSFIGYKVLDINSAVVGSGSVSTSGPKYDNGPSPQQGIVSSTNHNVVVTKNPANNSIRIQGTSDISILWGLIDIDINDYDITISLTTLKPI